LRQEAAREGFDALHHIDEALKALGIDPSTLATPRKTAYVFAKGEFQRKVIDALREPRTGPEIVRAIGRANMTAKVCVVYLYVTVQNLAGVNVCRHCFTQLVGQHESGLGLPVQIAG
jgi:hypothetical protein